MAIDGEHQSLVQKIRTDLLDSEDSVCLQRARLLIEAYERHESDPLPIKHAKAFAHVLANMELDLRSNPFFAGNTSSAPRAIMLLPEYSLTLGAQIDFENPGLATALAEGVPDNLRAWCARYSLGGSRTGGTGHLAVNIRTVVHRGLETIIGKAQKAGISEKDSASLYRRAMVTSLEAVIHWAHRYADEAQEAARREEDPRTAALLERVSAACRRVPAKPARNLFEGLQSILLVHLATAIEGHALSISIGLPDRVLAPLLPPEWDFGEAVDLISAFFLKITANSVMGRGSKTQAITVGGADANGKDHCSRLTLAFLEGCAGARVGDPHLFLRWHPGINPTVEARGAQLLAEGLSMPLLISDGKTVEGFIRAGIDPNDAWEYCVIGCNELGIPGLFADSANATHGTIPYVPALNEAIGTDGGTPPASVEDLLRRMTDSMTRALEISSRHGEENKRYIALNLPTPFTSSLMDGCSEAGHDFIIGMKYRCAGMYERGFTNTVNGLAAIQELCFDRKTVSIENFAREVADNFPSDDTIGKIRACAKWGTGDEEVDAIAGKILEAREQAVQTVFGNSAYTVCHVVRSLHHVDGLRLGATPDGRRAGEPLADSIGAETGTAGEGVSGILRSMSTIDSARYYRGGYNLNITVTPNTTSPDFLRSLVRGFFSNGGQELQVNCISYQTLTGAMKNPEAYGDLIVRIAGFSARFIDLPVHEQLELIERARLAEECLHDI